MNPWDRDELDVMMEDPWEEEQLGPPEEEQPDPLEAGQVEEPTAPIHDTSSAPTDTAAAAPVVALVLPVSEELSATTKRPRPVEPTAPTDAPLLAEALQPPPKLRRLLSKTCVPQHVCPTKTDRRAAWDKEKFEIEEDWGKKSFWQSLHGRQRYDWVYGKIRGFYTKHVYPLGLDKTQRKNFENLSGTEKQQAGRRAFKDLDLNERGKVVSVWMESSTPPKHISKFVEEHILKKQRGDLFGAVKQKGALLTWMLPPGMVDTSRVVEKQEPTALKQLVASLREECHLQELWKDIQLHAHVCLRQSAATQVAVCMEVCPKTWEEEKEVQLHFHAFLKSEGADLRIKQLHPYAFKDVQPHMSASLSGVSMKGNGRQCWSGFFYCCIAEKIGTLYCQATKLPFSGFLVSPTWILNLVQGKKLEPTAARALLVRCANGSRHVKELEAHEAHLEEEAVQKAEEEAQRLLSDTLKPSKQYPLVNAWIKQFEKARHRYKFLVLQGPSRVGKTAFARSLCDPGFETLEINCASGAEPDLRAYRLSKHGLILFDEIVPQQVVSQRKVFQAQSAKVQMGCSATNVYSYDIFVWRKKFVLASNNWDTSLSQLSEPDQAWIKANSVVLRVTEPMWEE